MNWITKRSLDLSEKAEKNFLWQLKKYKAEIISKGEVILLLLSFIHYQYKTKTMVEILPG